MENNTRDEYVGDVAAGGDAEVVESSGLVGEQPQTILAAQYEQYYVGPLPSPEVLAGYEQILPGVAERLVSTFEESVKHERAMDKENLNAAIRYANRGQNRGFVVTLLGLIIGAATVALGFIYTSDGAMVSAIIAGSAVSGLSVSRLVSKFIDGPRERRNTNK